MYELEVDATVDNLTQVLAFVEEIMERHEIPMKICVQINIAVEEIYVNIAKYAYPEGGGKAMIKVDIPEDNSSISITFIDSGIPYDPLKKPDPDVTLAAEDRPIGGLGIFMVKKSMDYMVYDYKDNCNILNIVKSV